MIRALVLIALHCGLICILARTPESSATISESKRQSCLKGKQSSRMLTCQRTCNKMPWIVQPQPLRNTTLKKTLLHTSRRNSTKNTIPHGIVLLEEISVATLPTRPSTSSISIWDKLPSFSSNLVKCHS
uniref:Secreted protein n=1 Tax=Magallana gigas TaxID=29159 RepID=A0A8W8KA54_MAGGI